MCFAPEETILKAGGRHILAAAGDDKELRFFHVPESSEPPLIDSDTPTNLIRLTTPGFIARHSDGKEASDILKLDNPIVAAAFTDDGSMVAVAGGV